MFSSKVSFRKMREDRLDANYYAPEYLENEEFLDNCPLRMEKIGSISEKCNCGSTPKKVVYDGQGIGLIRTSDVRPNLFTTDTVLRTSNLSIDRQGSTAALPNDLVFTMSGSVGYAAVLPEDSELFSFSNTIARVRLFPKSGNDSRFTAAFFNSSYGYKQTMRLVSGGIQGHVMPNPFRELSVPLPDPRAQAYIGDKVRQAERLRQRARELEAEQEKYFASIMTPSPAGKRKSYRTSVSLLNEKRLDAKHYDPAYECLTGLLREQHAAQMSDIAEFPRDGWQGTDEFLYFEIGGQELSTGRIIPSQLPVSEAPSRAQLLLRQWDVLVSTVRPNRKNVAIVTQDSSSMPMVGSTGFSVLRFRSPEAAVYYHGWLRTDVSTMQLMQWDAGATYPAIDNDIPAIILVPSFSQQEVDEWGRRWRYKFESLKFSDDLIVAAKGLIESLIEGSVSEDELVASQEALQQGNRELDRAILARMTSHGIDVVDAPKLFPDLDALYGALDGLGKEPQENEVGHA